MNWQMVAVGFAGVIIGLIAGGWYAHSNWLNGYECGVMAEQIREIGKEAREVGVSIRKDGK